MPYTTHASPKWILTRSLWLILAIAAMGIVVAGCGGDSGDNAETPRKSGKKPDTADGPFGEGSTRLRLVHRCPVRER